MEELFRKMIDMRKKWKFTFTYLKKNSNRGTTMVEMIVCFALLAIFMTCATMILSIIVNMYFGVRGEIYSKEVSDIVMQKISSEIDGAKYYPDIENDNPQISSDHKSISLYDRTDTRVKLSNDNNKGLVVHYDDITVNGSTLHDDSREQTDWYFNDAVYKGFKVVDISFYQGGDIITDPNIDLKDYGLSGLSMSNYDDNIVLVLMKMNSGKYGDYYYYRFVKMYNVTS